MMQYKNLGRSGLRVSCLGFGTWVNFSKQTTEEAASEMISLAYESGVNVFDTAESYSGGSCEILLGKILKEKGWRRSSYVVITKIFYGGKAETERGLSRKHIIEGVKQSLERLQLSYVDVVLAAKSDPFTPIEETVRAFTQLIHDGLCFYWGTSRWTPMEIMDAYSISRQCNLIPPMVDHMEYNWLFHDRAESQMPEMYRKIGLGGIGCSPLAGGYLSGKYEEGVPNGSRAALKGFSWMKERVLSEEGRQQQVFLTQLHPLANRLECTLAQLAIAWCLKSDHLHCILIGASRIDQLKENLDSLQVVPKLTPSIMQEIDSIIRNKAMKITDLRHITSGQNMNGL